MTNIPALEKRLQIEQEALERAHLFNNPVAIALYTQGVNIAQRNLNKALIRDAINQPASARCNSGGKHGCTCSACF